MWCIIPALVPVPVVAHEMEASDDSIGGGRLMRRRDDGDRSTDGSSTEISLEISHSGGGLMLLAIKLEWRLWGNFVGATLRVVLDGRDDFCDAVAGVLTRRKFTEDLVDLAVCLALVIHEARPVEKVADNSVLW